MQFSNDLRLNGYYGYFYHITMTLYRTCILTEMQSVAFGIFKIFRNPFTPAPFPTMHCTFVRESAFPFFLFCEMINGAHRFRFDFVVSCCFVIETYMIHATVILMIFNASSFPNLSLSALSA